MWKIECFYKFRCTFNSSQNMLTCHLLSENVPNRRPSIIKNVWRPIQPIIILLANVIDSIRNFYFSSTLTVESQAYSLPNRKHLNDFKSWVVCNEPSGSYFSETREYRKYILCCFTDLTIPYTTFLWREIFMPQPVRSSVQLYAITELALYASVYCKQRNLQMWCIAVPLILLCISAACNGSLLECI